MRTLVMLIVVSLALSAAAVGEERKAELPTSWDWRDVDGVDYLSSPRNVQGCGSSFIFGAVAVIEARYRIAAVRLGGSLPDVDYSEQHVMACGSGYFGGFDCDGGYTRDVFTHIRHNGVPSEDCYEYEAVDGECPAGCPDSADEPDLARPVGEIGELTTFAADAAIMQEIHDNGPVATTMDLYSDFYSYASGVYAHVTGDLSGSTVVVIVGWGEESGTPYWICRNVWGIGWGQAGDFLVARNAAHADCEFGKRTWWCSIDETQVAAEATTMGGLKGMFR